MTTKRRLTLAQVRSIQDDVRLLQSEWRNGALWGAIFAVATLGALAFAAVQLVPYFTGAPIVIRL